MRRVVRTRTSSATAVGRTGGSGRLAVPPGRHIVRDASPHRARSRARGGHRCKPERRDGRPAAATRATTRFCSASSASAAHRTAYNSLRPISRIRLPRFARSLWSSRLPGIARSHRRHSARPPARPRVAGCRTLSRPYRAEKCLCTRVHGRLLTCWKADRSPGRAPAGYSALSSCMRSGSRFAEGLMVVITCWPCRRAMSLGICEGLSHDDRYNPPDHRR